MVWRAERQRGEEARRHRAPKHHTSTFTSTALIYSPLKSKKKIPLVFLCSFPVLFPHTLTHTIPNAYKLGGVLISLTHEASFLGHQLTEAGLGRDGAQEVSHCPAAEPAAWVLQSLSLLPHLQPPSSLPPSPLFPSLL